MSQNHLGRVRYGSFINGTGGIKVVSRGSMYAPGQLASGLNTDCPPTMAESADGLLLIANGIDPVLRWDGIARKATPAGVMPPQSALTFIGRNALNTSTGNPTGGGDYETVSFDFSRFGRLATQTGLSTALLNGPGGNYTSASFQARQDAWNQYSRRIFDTFTEQQIGSGGGGFIPQGSGIAMTLPSGVRGMFFGRTVTEPTGFSLGYRRSYWTHLKFQLRLKIVVTGDTIPTLPEISGRYVVFYRYEDEFGNVSNPSPLTGDQLLSNASEIVYSGVEPPVEERVKYIQIWRSTAGQAQLFFLDVRSTDINATTFSSTRTDTELQLQESEAAFGSEYEPLLWRHGVPPANKPYIESHQNRMVLAGDRPYREGMTSVTFGSAVVTGVGTRFSSSLVGRFYFSQDAPRAYEVLTVDSETQLTLIEPYQGRTNLFQPYAVRSAAERNLVYFSEVGLPESWPATNAIYLNENNDEISGLMSFRGYCNVLKRRSIFRLAFDDLGGIPEAYPVVDRGCINQQCAVAVDDVCWMLDELGIHAFDGSNSKPASEPIQDIFRAEDDGYRINWDHSCRFHAVLSPGQHLIRWFVCLSGIEQPRHAICFNYRQIRYWIEEFPVPITGSVLATVGNRLRPLVGTGDGKICALDVGTLDLVDPETGTTRFPISAATLTSVTASLSSGEYLPASVVGAPIAITLGKGKGQVRRIVSVSGNTLNLSDPWSVLPSSTRAPIGGGLYADKSIMQIGAMPWRWKSGAFPFVEAARKNPRDVTVHWNRQESGGTMDVRYYEYGNSEPTDVGVDQNRDGVTVHKGNPDREVDLTVPKAAMQDGRGEWEDKGKAVQAQAEVELRGFTGEDKLTISRVVLRGCVPRGQNEDQE